MNQGTFSDYHFFSVGKLTDYYDTGTSFVETRGALFTAHIADDTWIKAGNRGSRLSWFSTLTTC